MLFGGGGVFCILLFGFGYFLLRVFSCVGEEVLWPLAKDALSVADLTAKLSDIARADTSSGLLSQSPSKSESSRRFERYLVERAREMMSTPSIPVAESSSSASNIDSGNGNCTLDQSQIDSFKRDGILVVSLLTPEELNAARDGLKETLEKCGVDISSDENLAKTGQNLASLSSTNGSGGVLDIFYPKWKMDIALNSRLFAMTKQLWREAYCHCGEDLEDLSEEDNYMWHPFGAFDPSKGYAYIDRIGYRIPSILAEELGEKMAKQNDRNSGGTREVTRPPSRRKRSRLRPIQRSLTPHLDCCPYTYDSPENKAKFRPIQCMVSLTDNLEANTGGFECVPGFHRRFREWVRHRKCSVVKTRGGDERIQAPCIGEYTHIRPKEDAEVFSSIEHVGIRAGDAVFWDNRLPHSNAYKHMGTVPRSVIYCSFLPDVETNRCYVERQLHDYLHKRKPGDQWIDLSAANDKEHYGDNGTTTVEDEDNDISSLDHLSRCLLGIDSW